MRSTPAHGPSPGASPRAGRLRRTTIWSTALRFSRRKRGSGWAGTNKARVARLSAEGLMLPAGVAAVEAAKADGCWSPSELASRGERANQWRLKT